MVDEDEDHCRAGTWNVMGQGDQERAGRERHSLPERRIQTSSQRPKTQANAYPSSPSNGRPKRLGPERAIMINDDPIISAAMIRAKEILFDERSIPKISGSKP
jgi:hypothetical protein